MSEQIITALRELLLGQFNEQELAQLCEELGLSYDTLPGEGAFGKTRSMIMACQSNNKLYTLVARARDLRPEAYAESALPALIASDPSLAAPEKSAPAPSAGETVRQMKEEAARPGEKRDLRRIITLIAAIGLALLVCMLLGDGLLGLLNRAGEAAATPAPTLPPVSTSAPKATVAVIQPATTATLGLPTPLPVPTYTPAQPAVSSPAAQRIIDLNKQLVNYYQGQVKSDALTEYWTAQGAKAPIAFYETTMPRVLQLAKPVAPGAVAASVKYVSGPAVTAETASGATISTREAWKYTNTVAGNSGCETRDYVYTLVNEDGKLKVSDVSGKLVSSGCGE